MRPRLPASLLLPACLAAWAALTPAWAEKADRSKPLVVESDGKQAASVDLAKRTTTVTGNVLITQGTLQIKADRVDVREGAPGRFSATAVGAPATFRQKRDRLDEYIEAQAQRIEYDGGVDRVRLIGEARMRVLRNGQPADEATAAVIVYDQPSDTLTFEGGGPASSSAGASAPASGRPRLVFIPRAASEAAR
mgnify:FL=1